MVLHPEVQQKAQAELDNVVGMNRLPDFNDRNNLPYLSAVCKEVHRWHPVLPLGIAHRVTQDDEYRDNFIPGGSIIVGNTWYVHCCSSDVEANVLPGQSFTMRTCTVPNLKNLNLSVF